MADINSRLYHLDVLRGILMTLGIVLHSMAVFDSTQTWKIQSEVSVIYASVVVDAIHAFRMPAFFIIGGFFSVLVILKQGENKYILDRILRLGLPLIFAGVFFNLPLAPFVNNGVEGNNWIEYIYTGAWLGHLWFLGNLILYSFILFILWKGICKFIFVNKRYTWLVYMLILSVSYPIAMRLGWYMSDYSINLIFLHVENIFQYLPYFFLGVILYSNYEFVKIKERFWLWLIGAIASYFISKNIDFIIFKNISEFIFASTLSFFLFSVFERYLFEPKPWKKKFADSSYTVYLVHQPILILVGLIVLSSQFNEHINLFIMLCITAVLSYLTYFKIVNKSPLLLFLMNGKKLKKIV